MTSGSGYTVCDTQLTVVSGECVRVKSAVIGCLTKTGPSSLASAFYDFLDSQAKLLAVQTNTLAIQSGPPSAQFSGEDIEVEVL